MTNTGGVIQMQRLGCSPEANIVVAKEEHIYPELFLGMRPWSHTRPTMVSSGRPLRGPR